MMAFCESVQDERAFRIGQNPQLKSSLKKSYLWLSAGGRGSPDLKVL